MSDLFPGGRDARERAMQMNARTRQPTWLKPPPVLKPPLLPSPRVPPVLAKFLKPHEPFIRKGSLLSPAELERFGNLLLFARSTVEGYFAGKHKH